MKPIMMIGILLIVLGVGGLAYERITYTTTEKAIDLGPIEVTTKEKHSIPIPQIAGILILVAGIAMVFVGAKRA